MMYDYVTPEQSFLKTSKTLLIIYEVSKNTKFEFFLLWVMFLLQTYKIKSTNRSLIVYIKR